VDIRPNLAKKRVPWLPKFRLNWKFDWAPNPSDVRRVYNKYSSAIFGASEYRQVELTDSFFDASSKKLRLVGGKEVETTLIRIAGALEFWFLPFEVSHLFCLDSARICSGAKVPLI
jgi:hypothetical protein